MSDKEIAGKLLSSGLTLYSIFLPVLIMVLTIGSDPGISSNYKDLIDFSMLYFIPSIVILSIQLLTCIFILLGYNIKRELPSWLTALVVLYLSVGAVGFAVHMVWT